MTVGRESVRQGAVLGASVRGLAVIVALVACGCKSQPAPRAPSRIDDTRKDPLTVEEVEETVRGVAQDFGACYHTERRQLVVEDLSEYVLQLRVPVDGKAPEVTVVKSTIPAQKTLEQCVVNVLAKLRFPAHPGKRITLNVPIKEASR